MSAISGVSSPTAHYSSHVVTQTKTLPTPYQALSSGAKAPTGQDSDGDKDGSVGTKINTFA
jgi:hypothetical protein